MRELTVEECKKIELELLLEIKEFCNKHNIQFYLIGGTLLGAVRHKGFIPWDDDIDIYMPRPHYDRFIKLYNAEINNNILYEYSTDKNYRYMFAKLCKRGTKLIEKIADGRVNMGVFVDIFPIDGLGNSESEGKAIIDEIKPYTRINMYLLMKSFAKASRWYKQLPKLLMYTYSKMHNPKKIRDKINKIARTYDYDSSLYVGSFIDIAEYKRVMPKSIFSDVAYLEFEGYEFPTPIQYREWLTRFYGDYMKLPPVSQQVYTHGFDAYIEE